MKQRFSLFRRGAVFYCEDTTTKQQTSLRTKSEEEARTILHSKNEAYRQPHLNLQIARTYLAAIDPQLALRPWSTVMEEMGKAKTGPTLVRHGKGMKDRAFDSIRDLPILETQAMHFQRVLAEGTVSTNVFLRRLQNYALGMNWLPWPILPKKCWPEIVYKEKRAVTLDEHRRLVADEFRDERRAYYECLWHLGGAQSDVASLTADNIDWNQRLVSFRRKKTGTPSNIRIGDELARILEALPRFGPLFPRLHGLTETTRAKEFATRCRHVGISGISLHSYRYAWAERAKSCGYPERYAQEALGHQSKAVARFYARKAVVTLPALEEYEKKQETHAMPLAATG